MSTRRLVIETRADGVQRAVSLPFFGWQLYDEPPPQPSPEELRDEIGLILADAGIGEQPLIGFDANGEPRLVWPEDIEKIAEAFVTALGPTIRRTRRLRRSLAKARQQKQPKRKHTDTPEVIELVQQPGGRWLPVSPSEGIGHGVYTIARSTLNAVRQHADDVHRHRRGFESLGALVLSDDGRSIERYTKLANPVRSAGRAHIEAGRLQRRPDGLPCICLHSHPEARATPSRRDVETAGRYGWEMFAIHGLDGLRLWAPDGGGGCREIPYEIAP